MTDHEECAQLQSLGCKALARVLEHGGLTLLGRAEEAASRALAAHPTDGGTRMYADALLAAVVAQRRACGRQVTAKEEASKAANGDVVRFGNIFVG